MRSVLLAALVIVLSAACGAYQFPGPGASPSPEIGTVSGRVVSVPCSPVQQLGVTCAGRPVPKLELDYVTDDGAVIGTVTDGNGVYSIALGAGTYAVKLKTYMRVLAGPLTLTITPGANLVANYTLDSGIRYPVPVPAPAAQQ
jgi:hypothetical protein